MLFYPRKGLESDEGRLLERTHWACSSGEKLLCSCQIQDLFNVHVHWDSGSLRPRVDKSTQFAAPVISYWRPDIQTFQGQDIRVRHSKRQHYFRSHLIFQHNKSSTKFLRLSTRWCSNTNTWATITKTLLPSILPWLSSQPFIQLSMSPHISIIFHNLFILRELTEKIKARDPDYVSE